MQKKAQTPRDSGDTSKSQGAAPSPGPAGSLREISCLSAKASEKHLEQLPKGFPLIFREYLFP